MTHNHTNIKSFQGNYLFALFTPEQLYIQNTQYNVINLTTSRQYACLLQ